MVALLVFITATLAEKKNCWTQKGLFGDNVIKNPARYTLKTFEKSSKYSQKIIESKIDSK